MKTFENIIITDIQPPITVHSECGRSVRMNDRPSYGLSLCASGRIIYTMNQKSYISNPSNAILLPQGGTYSLYGQKEGLFPVINFSCEHFRCDEILVFPLENPQACLKKFEALKAMFLSKKNHLKIYGAFYELLDSVSSFHAQNQGPLSPIIQYITKNIKSPDLSNTCIAEQIGISEVYLRKLFLTYYNITPKQYILNKRIQMAKQMLIDTSFTVTAISEECGFSSLYHFCRAFKEKTGMTPTEYAGLHRIYQI